jgi:predicted DNA-binding transcriptional regulator AlpA
MTRKREPTPDTQETDVKVLRPSACERRYGVSAPTRWRWEKSGRLPPRDVQVGGKPWGWYESTLIAHERGESV